MLEDCFPAGNIMFIAAALDNLQDHFQETKCTVEDLLQPFKQNRRGRVEKVTGLAISHSCLFFNISLSHHHDPQHLCRSLGDATMDDSS